MDNFGDGRKNGRPDVEARRYRETENPGVGRSEGASRKIGAGRLPVQLAITSGMLPDLRTPTAVGGFARLSETQHERQAYLGSLSFFDSNSFSIRLPAVRLLPVEFGGVPRGGDAQHAGHAAHGHDAAGIE